MTAAAFPVVMVETLRVLVSAHLVIPAGPLAVLTAVVASV